MTLPPDAYQREEDAFILARVRMAREHGHASVEIAFKDHVLVKCEWTRVLADLAPLIKLRQDGRARGTTGPGV